MKNIQMTRYDPQYFKQFGYIVPYGFMEGHTIRKYRDMAPEIKTTSSYTTSTLSLNDLQKQYYLNKYSDSVKDAQKLDMQREKEYSKEKKQFDEFDKNEVFSDVVNYFNAVSDLNLPQLAKYNKSDRDMIKKEIDDFIKQVEKKNNQLQKFLSNYSGNTRKRMENILFRNIKKYKRNFTSLTQFENFINQLKNKRNDIIMRLGEIKASKNKKGGEESKGTE